MNYQKTVLLSFMLLLSVSLFAQLGKGWPYSANHPYTLKGPVKSLIMTGEKGVLRTQHYSREGVLTKDESANPLGSSSSKSSIPPAVKMELEMQVDTLELTKNPQFSYLFNERSQVVEKRSPNFVQQNLFDDEGRIVISKTKSFHTQTRAWNGNHHAEPTYTYTDTIQTVSLFYYNEMSALIDFQHHNNNMDHSYRVVYQRDSANQVIERLEYDNIEISYSKDDSATRIAKAAIDGTFDLDELIPHFWHQGGTTPLKETYSYDENGNQVGYTCHCLRTRNAPFESFKAEWEYDDEGRIIKETQYSRHEYYQDYWESAVLLYDTHENVVHETIHYGDQTYIYTYAIEYWD